MSRAGIVAVALAPPVGAAAGQNGGQQPTAGLRAAAQASL